MPFRGTALADRFCSSFTGRGAMNKGRLSLVAALATPCSAHVLQNLEASKISSSSRARSSVQARTCPSPPTVQGDGSFNAYIYRYIMIYIKHDSSDRVTAAWLLAVFQPWTFFHLFLRDSPKLGLSLQSVAETAQAILPLQRVEELTKARRSCSDLRRLFCH